MPDPTRASFCDPDDDMLPISGGGAICWTAVVLGLAVIAWIVVGAVRA